MKYCIILVVIIMMDKVINLLKNSNFVLPKTLLLNYKDLKIDEKDLIVLIYILNDDNVFNPQKIGEDLKLKLPEVLEIIEKLNNADLISINVDKSDGIMQEKIDLTNLYKKLAYKIINEEEVIENKKTNIYDDFEKEFGRTLSPIEYELISGWLDNYSEEIIICALKEAVFNGVSNLRYIDKILYEWKKKGINTKDDIEKDRQKFKKNNINKTEMFDYDWLNDGE
jgi:DNA replication protein